MKKQTQEVSSSKEQKAGDTQSLVRKIYEENNKKTVVSRQGGSRWTLDKEKVAGIRERIKSGGKPYNILPQEFADLFGISVATILRRNTKGEETVTYYKIWKKFEQLGFKDLHTYTCWIDGKRGIQIRVV